MSIKYRDKRIVKLFKEEYNLIILMRYKYPFSELIVKTHNGRPTFIERGIDKTSLSNDVKDIGPRNLADEKKQADLTRVDLSLDKTNSTS